MVVTASMQSLVRSTRCIGARKANRAFTANIRNIPILTRAGVHQGRSQGGAQGARAPPLSCRAMTSFEHCLATHVVTLASCKLEFTLLELVVATIISCSTQTRLYTSLVQRAWEGPHATY